MQVKEYKEKIIEMITGIADINTLEYLHEFVRLTLEPQEG